MQMTQHALLLVLVLVVQIDDIHHSISIDDTICVLLVVQTDNTVGTCTCSPLACPDVIVVMTS